jgi:hypothetical protein
MHLPNRRRFWYALGMNKFALRLCLGLLTFGIAAAHAQVIPATPKKFGKRGMSSSTGTSGTSITTNGGSITLGPSAPAPSTKMRTTSYISLTESRQWKSNDGKSLLGKLIAFEDVTAETEKGAPAPAITLPAHPPVVKDGKARFLVGMRPYELPLDRLSQQDREFVEGVRDAAANSTVVPPQPNPAAK